MPRIFVEELDNNEVCTYCDGCKAKPKKLYSVRGAQVSSKDPWALVLCLRCLKCTEVVIRKFFKEHSRA